MKTKTAKTKKSDKQKPAATKNKDQSTLQTPRKAGANDKALDETPEPPQMMHPLSDEERARKKD